MDYQAIIGQMMVFILSVQSKAGTLAVINDFDGTTMETAYKSQILTIKLLFTWRFRK